MRSPGTVLRLAVAATLIAIPTSAWGAAVDLGSLQVPASRVPDWQPGPEGGVPDTSSWPTVNALEFGAVPNDGGDDTGAINAAIDNAAGRGGNQVVYLPPGTYRFSNGTSIRMRSNVVLRGAGADQTVITGDRGASVNGIHGGLHFVGSRGGDVAVTGGNLSRGSSAIQVADASAFKPGDYVLLFQDTDWSYIQHDNGRVFMSHIFKVLSVSGSTVAMDRPLRHGFNSGLNVRASRISPVSNAGLERLKIQNDDNAPDKYIGIVAFKYAINSWAKDVFFYNGQHYHVEIAFSARNAIRDSRFERMLWAERGNGSQNYAIDMTEGSIDNLITNNVFVDQYSSINIHNGANGNVYSYNFHTGNRCRQGIFFHGHYPHSNLVEGNDSYCAIQAADKYWGQQGPYNTAFRNRLRDGGRIKTESLGEPNPPQIVDQFNLIANSANAMHQTPFCDYDNKGNCGDFDAFTSNMWMERNVARDGRGCGAGACYGLVVRSPESSTTMIENVSGGDAPASWSNAGIPPSLYLTAPPDFWPEGKPWPAIGADVDRPGSQSLHKLPAQEWFEGIASSGTSAVPPAAPVQHD